MLRALSPVVRKRGDEMIKTVLQLIAFGALATAGASAADAAVTYTRIDFTANYLGNGPNPTLTGNYTFSYDTVTDTYALTAVNFSLNGMTFTLANTGIQKSAFAVSVGGTDNGNLGTVGGVANGGVTDFAIAINPVVPNPGNPQTPLTGRSFIYSLANSTQNYVTTNVTTTATAVAAPAGVPEPATWTMMIGGFGAAGAATRRRRLAGRVRFA